MTSKNTKKVTPKFEIYAKVTLDISKTISASTFEEASKMASELLATDFVDVPENAGINDYEPIEIYSICKNDD